MNWKKRICALLCAAACAASLLAGCAGSPAKAEVPDTIRWINATHAILTDMNGWDCAVFGGIIWFTRRFCPDKAIGPIPARPLLAGAASCFFGLIGCFLILRGLPLSYQLHLVFLVQPFFAVGWLATKNWLMATRLFAVSQVFVVRVS